MHRTRVELLGVPDRRLDPFRRGVAQVFDGDRVLGWFATRVDVLRTTEGPFWRRRDVRPVELPEWCVLYVPGREELAGFDEGIVFPEWLDESIRDWALGLVRVGDRVLRLEWMHGDGADETWRSCWADRP